MNDVTCERAATTRFGTKEQARAGWNGVPIAPPTIDNRVMRDDAQAYSDANVSNKLADLLRELRLSDVLEFPPDAEQARRALRVLTDAGCKQNILLQLTHLYALFHYAMERNKVAESDTRPEDRRVAFPGVHWRRKDVDRIARTSRELADEAERFLFYARVPDENLRMTFDVLAYHKALPDVLRRFANFVEDVANRALVVNELPAQRARFIADLHHHVLTCTERPHYAELLEMILGWRGVYPFEETLSEDALRMQVARQANSFPKLPSLTDRPSEQQ